MPIRWSARRALSRPRTRAPGSAKHSRNSASAEQSAEDRRQRTESPLSFVIRPLSSVVCPLMLTRLSIRDIVLIDRLDIDFVAGLSVLTGETGAGKSILLDAFALALGARGDAGLVRHGAEQGQVTASFDVARGYPVWS